MEVATSLLHSQFLPPKPQSLPFSTNRPTSLSSSQNARGNLTIASAITRTRKEETVANVKTQMEDCYLIAAIDYTGFTVKQFQDLRKAIPETSKLLVAKNTLVYKAFEGTPWVALQPCMKGMTAFLFVHSEEIPEALKPVREFQKENKLETTNDFAGAVFEGKYYPPEEFKQLETMPSRAEVYAKLLGSLQSPAIGLVSTLQAPARDVLLVLKAYIKKLEDEGNQ